MKYKVIIDLKAEKQLNKLDNSIKLKIMKYIKQNLNDTDFIGLIEVIKLSNILILRIKGSFFHFPFLLYLITSSSY